jgi:hypothetical protein
MMRSLMTNRWIVIGVLVLALLLALAAGLGQAQGPEPGEQVQPEGAESLAEDVLGYIPIQGRLTDANGNPLNGTHTLTFRFYDAALGGSAVCEGIYIVEVTNGLFDIAIGGTCDSSDIKGQQLYLGLDVDNDGEMEPRQAIYPVPYARSLLPGAVIEGDVPDAGVLQVANLSQSSGSIGIQGRAGGLAATNYGVYGSSLSPFGYGGYFVGATFLGDGVALKAAGSGIIQSSAESYLWISGNSLQKANSDDTTRWEYDDYGGYKVYRGSDVAPLKRVVLPVTIPGQLYGQNVRVTGMDLYYTIDGDFAEIDAVIVRRQDGVGAGNGILYDDTPLHCGVAQCTKHWDLTQNNVLSDQRGILHIVLRLDFADGISYVQVGGVRLTLEHD